MKTDIEISNEAKLSKIEEIAKKINISRDDLILYGDYKAKVNIPYSSNTNSKLVLLTGITPTKGGEGKTTLSIGLAQGLKKINKSVCLALREPSMGPTMGLKGGATGGGYAQVCPMDEINLHFTGDFHAITSANNLVSSVIDNILYQGNPLNIDPERIVWKRCLDNNDRSLREVTVGQGSKFNGVERKDSFVITVATEVMAILALSKDIKDLEDRLNKCLVAYTKDGKEVFLKDLGITGALLTLLKDAIKPNLVQSLEGVPAFIHCGPFANIAHGCNSVIATNAAMQKADYTITEAGFGADLGAEKFLDIKSRIAGLNPNVVVIVCTIRALKMHGGVLFENLKEENIEAMLAGTPNLERHLQTLKNFNKKYIVGINRFSSDTNGEVEALEKYLSEKGHPYSLCEEFTKGGDGCIDLANKVVELSKENTPLHYLYELDCPIKDKIFNVSSKAYGASAVEYSELAQEKIAQFEKEGYGNLPICMAKTQNSVTDDAKVLGAPTNFTIHVKDVSLSRGAGFIVVYTGKIITMPGLPEHPAAMDVYLDDELKVQGLF